MFLVILLTSCTKTDVQEVSRTVQYSNISTITSTNNEREELYKNIITDPSDEKSSMASWTGNPAYTPEEYDFSLGFSQDFCVIDYGKSDVCVYQAEYEDSAEDWYEEWVENWVPYVYDWCTGWPITVDGAKYYVQNAEISTNNIENVQLRELSEIEEHEELLNRFNLQPDSRVLCWTYDIVDFPWSDFRSLDYFSAPEGLNTISYVRLCAQYVDGLPVNGGISGTRFPTYEWTGVVGPSKAADREGDILHVNPSHTTICTVNRNRYKTTKTIMKNQEIVLPQECLSSIKKAILYDPQADIRPSATPTKEELLHVWGKSVEVYCAELSYMALDSCLISTERKEEHEIFLVPVWKIYYLITNPKNDTSVAYGQVMINAITGESLFSEQFGPDENTALYPELLLPG